MVATKHRDNAKLVDLVSDKELPAFAKILGAPAPHTRDALRKAALGTSAGAVVAAVAEAASEAVRMLHDVASFLVARSVRARTTGFVLVLPARRSELRVTFGPQQVGLLLQFDRVRNTKKYKGRWRSILENWRSNSARWIATVLQRGTPTARRRFNRRNYASGRADIFDRRCSVESGRAAVVLSLFRSLRYVYAKLAAASDARRRSTPESEVLDQLARACDQATECLANINRDPNMRDAFRGGLRVRDRREYDANINRWISDATEWVRDATPETLLAAPDGFHDHAAWHRWERVVEEILALATPMESDEVAELLRVDLLRHRPQLFEVWLLTFILSSYESAACTVELLHLVESEQGTTWNLKFAGDESPAAAVSYRGERLQLFFQLLQAGGDADDMPDIALSSGDGSGPFLWICDPKYSALGGYSRASYRATAVRYKEAFSPAVVWVCEYFARSNEFAEPVVIFEERASLALGVGEHQRTARRLAASLLVASGVDLPRTVLAVDCSLSFAAGLPSVMAEVTKLLPRCSELILFAGQARRVESRDGLDGAQLESLAQQLLAGTSLESLVACVGELDEMGAARLVVVTDGQFDDASGGLWATLESCCAQFSTCKDAAELIAEFAVPAADRA